MLIEDATKIGVVIDAMKTVLAEGDIMRCEKCGQSLDAAESAENLSNLIMQASYTDIEGDARSLEGAFSALTEEEQDAVAKAVTEVGVKLSV